MIIKFNKIKSTLDIILILGFFIFPLFSSYSPVFNFLDEIIILFFISVIWFKSFHKKIEIKYFNISIISFSIYSIFLIFKNKLPLENFIQFIITIKFIFVYSYFSLKSDHYKSSAQKKFIYTIIIIYILSVVISIFQFIMPNLFDTSRDGRGINGITLGGIFFSRTLYSQFIVFCMILIKTFSVTNNNTIFSFIYRNKNKLILFSFFLLFLTFTRKDLIFGLIILLFLYYKTFKGLKRGILNLFSIFLIGLIPLVNNIFFKKINEATFNDEQVRLIILNSGLSVLDHYKPFGSGPGTFGSIMSIKYDYVYKKFNVPERVYKGLKGRERGPIFDVYIISLITEYGIGFLFFLIFYYSIYKSNNIESKYFNGFKILKSSIIIFVIMSSLTVPILNNIVGYLIFTFLGITSKSSKK